MVTKSRTTTIEGRIPTIEQQIITTRRKTGLAGTQAITGKPTIRANNPKSIAAMRGWSV
jgi:hypothetical protein